MPKTPDEKKAIEVWAAELSTDAAMFAVAKAVTPGWGLGKEVTRDEFIAALERAGKLEIR
jgi:hypothetical protein